MLNRMMKTEKILTAQALKACVFLHAAETPQGGFKDRSKDVLTP